MITSAFHPALVQLLGVRAVARARRLRHRLAAPRRLLLSALGLLLAALWLGNAALSILFREPADPETLRGWVMCGLFAYGVWHLVKVAYRRPEQGIEWSPAEQVYLVGGPFTRRQLLTYRLTTVCGAAVFKAACFAALMLPDLKLPLAGFCGAVAALSSLELWRMIVEITACGVSQATYRKLRLAVLLPLGIVGATMILIAMYWPAPLDDANRPALLALLEQLGIAAAHMGRTAAGEILTAPFGLFTHVMLADRFGASVAASLVGELVVISLLVIATLRIDAFFLRRITERQANEYPQRVATAAPRSGPCATGRGLLRFRWSHAGWALAWRQSLGVWHYRGSVLIALVAPTILALLPLLVYRDSELAFLNVVAAIAFYSLLLLPAALRFDFRRDVDRMALLKSLPVSPRTMVIGQLAVPVVIASVFQLAVLVVAALVRPVHPAYVAVCWLLLIPMNVLVYAMENVIFLLYPYRQNQEGLEIFLRTTLTFTAKGILFFVALSAMAIWTLIAGRIVRTLAWTGGPAENTRALFSIGVAVMMISAAFTLTHLNVRAYDRFDASQDTPG